MTVNRRDLLIGAVPIAAGASLLTGSKKAEAITYSGPTLDLQKFGLKADGRKDQTAALQKAMNEAARQRVALLLPGGTFLTSALTLPDNLVMVGVYGQTILKFVGGAHFIQGIRAKRIVLRDLTFDGGSKVLTDKKNTALLGFDEVSDLRIENCFINDSLLNGVKLTSSGGLISNSTISRCGRAGLFALDSTGLEVSSNHVHDCGNNGILIWRSAKGEDGTIVTQNRIERIKSNDGGTGQNGNGVNVFRAGSVLVSHNQIEDCVFSAIRNNGGDNVQILNNSCRRLGEVALYSEFIFEGAIISNNLVDEAHVGISITNFNQGGRLATATGNLIRNMKKRLDVKAAGIAVEADSVVSGNVIENVDGEGIFIGYRQYAREVSANNNIIRKAKIGIGVTGDPGAGLVMIATNMISGAKDGAIRALDASKPIGPDLSKQSSESYRHLAIFGNVGL